MAKITYLNTNGTSTTVDVADGMSLMQGAMAHGIAGIVGECGGSAMCATCHVYVDPDFEAKLPAPNAVELEMLDSVAAERRPNSRLSCQITASAAIHGMVLHLPECQT
jgi:ferredoxin, 2Fe-2S